MVFRQLSGTGYMTRMSHDNRYMEILSCLIGLTGTDFTRNMPFVGVKKLWSCVNTPYVWSGVLRSYDTEKHALDIHSTCNILISRVYSNIYSKHTVQCDSLDTILGGITSSSKISLRTKKMLPSYVRGTVQSFPDSDCVTIFILTCYCKQKRLDTTVRNINWLLIYWRCMLPSRDSKTGDWVYADAYPDPICNEYGFAREGGGTGVVKWLEEVKDVSGRVDR